MISSVLPEIPRSDLEFFEKLSSGGEGSVFKAKWKSRDTIVAVKRLLVLEKEAHVLSQIRHKNIVMFYGACTRPPDYYIVTEFAEMGSVYGYLHDSKNPSLDFTWILRWGLDIAYGVRYLHFEAPVKMLHRDLKSRNVVVTGNNVCKLCDFGTSKPLGTSTNAEFVGTAAWMSPEMLSSGRVNEGTDVWSYAVVLWELLTGEEPFHKMGYFQIATLILERDHRLTVPASTPEPFAVLIESCWETEPKDRPDFQKIVDSLETMKEDKDLEKQYGTFLQNKTEWLKELRQELEMLKKRENDIAEREKCLKKWERDLCLKEKNSEFQPAGLKRLNSYDVRVWDEKAVCRWLQGLTSFDADMLTGFCAEIEENHINGERLLLLTESDLNKLGLTSVGYQRHILEEIRCLEVENRRLMNFPPLSHTENRNKVDDGSFKIPKIKNSFLSPQLKQLEVSLLVGHYVREMGSGPEDCNWKMHLDYAIDDYDEMRQLREPLAAFIKEVVFIFPNQSEPCKLTKYPYVMEVWLSGLKEVVGVRCVVNFAETVVQKPRNTRFTVNVDYSNRGNLTEKVVQLSMKEAAFLSKKQQKKQRLHLSDSSPALQGIWNDRKFADAVPIIPVSQYTTKSPVWSQIAASLRNPSAPQVATDRRKASAPTPRTTPSPSTMVLRPELAIRASSEVVAGTTKSRSRLAGEEGEGEARDISWNSEQDSADSRPKAYSLTPDLRYTKQASASDSVESAASSGEPVKERGYRRSQSEGVLKQREVDEEEGGERETYDLSPVSEGTDDSGLSMAYLKKQDSTSKYSAEVHGGIAKLKWKN